MASFGVSMVAAGSVAAAAAGLANATMAGAPTAASAAGGGVHRAAHVSAGAVTAVQVVGNVLSIAALLIPMLTYVRPVRRAKGVGARTIYSFVYVFFNAMLWLLFAVRSKPRTVLTLTVNCVGIVSQVFYIYIYLKNAVHENFFHSRCVVMIAALIAVAVLGFAAPLVLMSGEWRVMVLGVFASTFATGTSLLGLIDVVIIVRAQRSGFNIYQLILNLLSAAVWAGYGFMFDPVNKFVVVPNLTAVGVTTVQIFFHAIQRWKDRRNDARNQPAA